MSAVGHYLEDEGIATVSISLVREHTEAMRPPRALWVPFMLGRPLGVPDDPVFQRRVLRAALELLDSPEGPVLLRDFPGEAPSIEERPEDMEGMACPLALPGPATDPSTPDGLAAALREEILQLGPWHDLTRARRRGSAFGLLGITVEQVGDLLVGTLAALSGVPDDAASAVDPMRLKLACDDLRTYYEESAAAQPGGRDPEAVLDWYYERTHAGRLIRRLRDRVMRSEDPGLRALGPTILVPRAILNR